MLAKMCIFASREFIKINRWSFFSYEAELA